MLCRGSGAVAGWSAEARSVLGYRWWMVSSREGVTAAESLVRQGLRQRLTPMPTAQDDDQF